MPVSTRLPHRYYYSYQTVHIRSRSLQKGQTEKAKATSGIILSHDLLTITITRTYVPVARQ